MTHPLQLAMRLEATIHKINGHWWNRRIRPHAEDIREAVDYLKSQAAEQGIFLDDAEAA